jgi:predicted metalloprotease with PDZ domain
MRVPRVALLVAAATVLASSVTAAPVLKLEVDAREAPRRLIHARLEIPAVPGPLTLLYPKWIPGEHAPSGPVIDLSGLVITAGGKTIPWRRDPVDMYTFHVDVPAGSRQVEVALDYLSPNAASGYSSSVSTSTELAVVSWNQVLLYPKTAGPGEPDVVASLRLPAGWKHGTALGGAKEAGGVVSFAPVSMTTLIDSPVVAGAHFRTVPLSSDPPVVIDMAADSEAALEMTAETKAAYERLVREAHALFGGHPYRSYHFLLSLSNRINSFGHEHHESSDNRVAERALLDEHARKVRSGLLPHEFVHAWNGKFRRPAGLAGGFQEPMQGELLWVYEGLTSYLGEVLTARSGLRSVDDSREALAWTAGNMEANRGREWRPLLDTAVAAQLLYGGRADWSSRRRGVDFYPEGVLLWLEADAVIRRESKGSKSLDDFCRRFFAAKAGPPQVVTYVFDDVVHALEAVQPYDWRGFWKTRVEAVAPAPPNAGLLAAGWKLGYAAELPGFLRSREEHYRYTDLRHSLGLLLAEDGAVNDVIPASPADRAGVAPGAKVLAVAGRRYSKQQIRGTLHDMKAPAPLELILENGDFFSTVKLEAAGGERYPVLEREAAQPDRLADILKPIAAGR